MTILDVIRGKFLKYNKDIMRILHMNTINRIIPFLGSFVYFSAFHAILPSFVGHDGYFHWRYSQLLGINSDYQFKALPYTIYKNRFIDHHWLFHKILIPFTFLGDRIGPHIAIGTFLTIFIGSMYSILKVIHVKFQWLWIIFLITFSPYFLMRLMMLRVNDGPVKSPVLNFI